MSFIDFLFGRPLATSEEHNEKIAVGRGIGIFGMDALGSAVYGPEAALTVLIPLGVAGISNLFPVTIIVVVIAFIVFLSYYQALSAYPGGGGTYTIAAENLGIWPGLVAASSLMIDYVLVVAVGIAAGVGTLVSMFPFLQKYTLILCLLILLIITVINLRGTGDSGAVFLVPAYLFIISLSVVLGIGIFKILSSGGHPQAVINPPDVGKAGTALTVWIWLRTFSIGSTAITGVEAVSNGIPEFRQPQVKNARITQSVIMGVLILMLVLIAWICKSYRIGATEPGSEQYRSVLYALVLAVIGNGWYSYIPVLSILLIVIFQANTSFTSFPRLCSIVSQQRFLPHVFASVGRRLVFSAGIYILSVLAAILLIAFRGITDLLIPLFAVAALVVFTLSQAGMFIYSKRSKGKHYVKSMLINAVGMTATGITAIIVLITRFTEGAWIVVVIIPAMLFLMKNVYSHYLNVEKQLFNASVLTEADIADPVVIMPFEDWNNNARKALVFSRALTRDIILLHISANDEDEQRIRRDWKDFVETPLKQTGQQLPRLEIIHSTYRLVVKPIVDFVLDFEKSNPSRQVALIIPMLVERKWFHRFLHNQRGLMMMGLLFAKGSSRTAVIHVPWYLKEEQPVKPAAKNADSAGLNKTE